MRADVENLRKTHLLWAELRTCSCEGCRSANITIQCYRWHLEKDLKYRVN